MKQQKSEIENPQEEASSKKPKQPLDKSSDPEHKRTKKPGSQSNSSKQSNNGRGGGNR